MNKKFISLTTATSLLALSSAASAQTIDYGSLEMLFDESVTTSATGKPQRASDAPVTMEIITAEEIRRSGATDIPEVLRKVSGVSVQRSTLGGVDVGIRGYNAAFNERVLVLINGRQVYLDHFGYVEWAALPVALSEIRQIEVVKGPNTALYGFNAVSGVINIITNNPLYDSGGTVTARVGTQDYYEVNGSYSGKLSEKIGLRVSGGLWGNESFDTPLFTEQEEFLREDDERREFFAAELLAQVTDNIQAGVEYTYSKNRQGELYFDHSYNFSRYQTDSIKGFLAAETSWGVTELTAYRNSLELNSRNPLVVEEEFGAPFIELEVDQSISVFELDHLAKIGTDHAVRGSIGYRNNQTTTFPETLGELTLKTWSFSGMWDWTISDKLSFVASGRYDTVKMNRTGDFIPNLPQTNEDFDRRLNEVSYNGGFVYKIDDLSTLRLTGGQGVDLPSPTEFSFMKAIEDDTFQAGNPELITSTARNIELGYDRSIPSINGMFRAAAFYYDTNDTQNIQQNEPQNIGDGLTAFFVENFTNSEAYGLEASIEGQATENLNWYANYLFVDVKDTQPPEEEDEAGEEGEEEGPELPELEAVDFEQNSPKHTLKFGLGYTKDKVELDLFASYTSKRRQLRAEGIAHGGEEEGGEEGGEEELDLDTVELVLFPVNASLNLNARFAYNFNDNLTLAVEGIGITQKEPRQTSLARIERRVNVSLNYRF